MDKLKKFMNGKGIRILRMMSCILVMAFFCASHVMASDVVSSINNLETLILGIVQAIGVIVVIWGVFDLGMGYMSHDGTQQTNGLKRIVAGLIMFFASQILTLLSVG